MSDPTANPTSEPDVDWAIFAPAIIIVLLSSVFLMVNTESAAGLVAEGRKAVMSNFLWVYLQPASPAISEIVPNTPALSAARFLTSTMSSPLSGSTACTINS